MCRNLPRGRFWIAVLCYACNRHDASTRPPPLSRQTPSAAPALEDRTQVSQRPAVGGEMGAVASEPAPDSSVSAGDGGTLTSRVAHTEPERIAQPCRILVIGDSLSDPKAHGGGYLKPWQKQCSTCEFTNLAHGGAMVNQMLRGLREHFTAPQPRYTTVVVFGGVNDLYSDQTAKRTNDRIQRDLSAIYQLARAHSDRVVAITVAPWGGFRKWYTAQRGHNTQLLNQWIVQGVGRGELSTAVESGPLLSCGDPEQLCPEYMPPFRDGLHFGPKGHHRLGAALLKAVQGDCR
jgi:lysophospholipase L1-like esterase